MQMEEQQVWTMHDGLPGQCGGHWAGLKHALQRFVLQDGQGRWRKWGEKGSVGCRYYEISVKKGKTKVWTY